LFLDYIYILAENADFVNHIIQQIAAQIQQISVHNAQNKLIQLNYAANTVSKTGIQCGFSANRRDFSARFPDEYCKIM